MKQNNHKIILAGIVLFHFISNLVYLLASKFYLAGNSSNYFLLSNDYLNNFFRNYMYTSSDYPPLVFIIAGVFLKIFTVHINTVLLVNILYLILILYATYGICSVLYNKNIGLLACFLLSFFPGIFGYSRVFLLDLPLASISTLIIYLLLKQANSDNGKNIIITGVALGLGLLVKWTLPLYIVPVLIYIVYKKKIPGLKQLLYITLIGLGLAATWYIPNFKRVYNYLFLVSSVPTSEFTVYNENYMHFLYNELLLIPFFIMFVVSFVFFNVRFRRPKTQLLNALILLPIMAFWFLPNRQPRYIIPVLPFIAVIISWFLYSLKKRKFLIFFMCEFVVIQFLLISFIPNKLKYLQVLNGERSKYRGYEHGLYQIIDQGDWKNDKIVEKIALYADNEKNSKVLIISPFPNIIYPVEMYSKLKKYDIAYFSPANQDQRELPERDFSKEILEYDFIIYKTGVQGIPWHQDYIDGMYTAFQLKKNEFIHIFEENLPDLSEVFIYKKRDQE